MMFLENLGAHVKQLLSGKADKDLSNVTTLPDAVKAQLKGDDGAPGAKGDPGIPGESGATANVASTTANGLMSKEDKVKLDSAATLGADGKVPSTQLPASTATTLGGVKVSLSGSTLTITTS